MIRFAEKTDVPQVMRFIDKHWKQGHILGRDERLFRYEFENNKAINIAISINDDGKIDGFEGFIPYGKNNRDIMLSMWKSINSQDPTLGLKLLQYIRDNSNSSAIACPGINKKVMGIYRYFGFTTGVMTQWYRLRKQEHYKIAVVVDSEIPTPPGKQWQLIPLRTLDDLKSVFDFSRYYADNPRPLKEAWYVEKRYYRHPVYRYKVYGIVNPEGDCQTIAVFRVQEHQGARALRFVDVIGRYPDVYRVTRAIDLLMEECDAEYTDFYECGLSERDMLIAGWKKVEGSGNVIPNYFSPFVQENIQINYCTDDANIALFKADGDQDRPN